MLKIASELKWFVNEVGYVTKIDNNSYKLRYFSSEREVEFCGHATIAIMYDIIKNTKELENVLEVSIITNKGQLLVENNIKEFDFLKRGQKSQGRKKIKDDKLVVAEVSVTGENSYVLDWTKLYPVLGEYQNTVD